MTPPSIHERYTVVEKDITGSTNTDALELARNGAPPFTLVWAREQTAARGRFNRKWIADRGNLYWSVIVRPSSSRIESLVFVAALAVRDAVRPFLTSGQVLEIKWPNDALIDDAKFSGILIEREGNAAVVGIGINVLLAPDVGQTIYPATSLKASGALIADVDLVCANLCDAFAHWYDIWEAEGFRGAMRESYVTSMWRLGLPLRVSLNAEKTEHAEGQNLGITEEGYLIIGSGKDEPTILATGDVLF